MLDIYEKIKLLDVAKENYEKLLAEMAKEPSSFEDLVFKKYIQLKALKPVFLFLKKNGICKDNGRGYPIEDISKIIRSTPPNVADVIINTAHEIFEKNKRRVDYWYN